MLSPAPKSISHGWGPWVWWSKSHILRLLDVCTDRMFHSVAASVLEVHTQGMLELRYKPKLIILFDCLSPYNFAIM